GYGTAVVGLNGVVGEGDQVAFRRDSWMSNPTAGLVEHFADWILQTVTSVDIANNGQRGAIWRPVGPLNLFHDLAWCAAANGGACQRPHVYPSSGRSSFEQYRHLSLRRDRHDLRLWKAYGARLRGLRPSGKNFY